MIYNKCMNEVLVCRHEMTQPGGGSLNGRSSSCNKMGEYTFYHYYANKFSTQVLRHWECESHDGAVGRKLDNGTSL